MGEWVREEGRERKQSEEGTIILPLFQQLTEETCNLSLNAVSIVSSTSPYQDASTHCMHCVCVCVCMHCMCVRVVAWSLYTCVCVCVVAWSLCVCVLYVTENHPLQTYRK